MIDVMVERTTNPPKISANIVGVHVWITDEMSEKFKEILPNFQVDEHPTYGVFLMDGRFWLPDPVTGRLGMGTGKKLGLDITEFVTHYNL